jgi:hypothetical protein
MEALALHMKIPQEFSISVQFESLVLACNVLSLCVLVIRTLSMTVNSMGVWL